ncbi:MAG: hypothetical protein IPH07_17780 [Deltaproteobacteria bacterium]|nr:hypothetical protein [Deltaproteobacteria bacterium]MBK8719426.1 hypothetical protein [Deltaproteobacteria bacterium]MBP7287151.1 hypothetical protein [Nannocystaceae bacterium]
MSITRAAAVPVVSVWVLAALAGCPRSGVEESGDSGTSSGGITVGSTSASNTTASSASASTSASTADSGSDTTDGTDTASSTDPTLGGSGSDSTTGNDPGNPVDCGGAIYACGDGEDNDGDGFIDLTDPECTGPCDDDESSFQTGLPGDNMDCKQDCFFDGNSGQGDDGCIWDLRCDAENPGANVGCEYTGGNNCNNIPPNQDPTCVMFCEQYVPPGCDCFGCCEVQTPDGPVHIFLNSGPDCSLDNLDACQPCTSQIDDCGVPCLPEECQVCFGETEPPPGCGENTCPGGDTCEATADCPTDFFCYLGCCYPPPPG